MGSQVVSLGGTGWSPQWLCRCCSVVALSGASKTSQLSIIFRLIWEQTDSSGSRLTLVSTGRRSSTRMVLRREPMAGSLVKYLPSDHQHQPGHHQERLQQETPSSSAAPEDADLSS